LAPLPSPAHSGEHRNTRASLNKTTLSWRSIRWHTSSRATFSSTCARRGAARESPNCPKQQLVALVQEGAHRRPPRQVLHSHKLACRHFTLQTRHTEVAAAEVFHLHTGALTKRRP